MESEKKYLPTDLPHEIPASFHHESQESYPDVKTLLSWSAPGRPYRKRGKQFFLTAILICFLLEVILFLFSQYLLMIVVVSLLFLSFSFAIVPPKNFHYRISSEGILVEDHFYIWRELYDFYFRHHDGLDTLYVRTEDFLPGALIISLGDVHKEQIKQAMLPFLPYREVVKPNLMERSGDWLYTNFPLERS